MTPFLYQVAREYVDREADSLLDYCFVFPNKRSCTFFNNYLRGLLKGRSVILPEITTIGGLTSSFSRLVPATRFEELFVMFNEYRKLSADIPDFDRFLFWGDMLITDFNDVDRYLVDPELLFVNVKRLKEINANYLTPEQVEIIRLYWGDEMEDYDPDKFWSHLSDESTELQGKFLKLWEILLPLYQGYCAELERNGLASEGMLLRNAVEKVKEIPGDKMPFRRYIFVGFNVLSAAEIRIFERLQAKGLADFYWDFNSPAFDLPKNKGARFMRHNIERFPSRYAIDTEKITKLPEITITCVPSRTGMVKETGEILRRWMAEGIVKPETAAADTAIVLPEEDLFIPMIHSVPTEIKDLNVTMGFPLKFTPMSSLLTAITSMQIRCRMKGGEPVYMLKDVMAVLSHPLVQSAEAETCNTVMSVLKAERRFLVPASFLTVDMPEAFGVIFTPVKDVMDPEAVYNYTAGLVNYLLSRTTDEDKAARIERYFLEGFADALEELHEAISQWGVKMKESTFFHLLRRSIASASVNFTGEPLRGLQMMGVLETRSLDFDNIIMLSMNERVFPRKHFTRSFIPDTLRHAYGMSTVEFQESIYAYYFYRLISRASRVELLYDGRTEGTRSGEMSRYLAQLLYLFPEAKIRHISRFFPAPKVTEDPISVIKTPEIMERLSAFTTTDPERMKYLSASSINGYINCPLSFYLKNVEGYDLDDAVTDYMDASTFGTILHEVMERIYKNLRGNHSEVKITSEILDKLNNPLVIEPLVTEGINNHYNRRGPGCLDKLTGESFILGNIMAKFVSSLLEKEKQFAPFDFIDAERRIVCRMPIDETLTVNIKQVIDRIDRVADVAGGRRLRVVDYKTGGDLTTFSGLSQLFDRENDKRRKAILQLMFYCNVLAAETGEEGPIQPMIYLFKTLSTKGLLPVTFDGDALLDYRAINEDFMAMFRETVKEIFDPEVPFTQPVGNHACKFCNFKPVCGRPDK